eukprot:3770914-Amphidinium_carterae.1
MVLAVTIATHTFAVLTTTLTLLAAPSGAQAVCLSGGTCGYCQSASKPPAGKAGTTLGRGTVCQVVRDFWLLVGPKLRMRPEQWPRVRFPPPKRWAKTEPVEVIPVEETNLLALPYVVGLHKRVIVVEQATYAICLDCNRHVGIHTGRKNINYHALKGPAFETQEVCQAGGCLCVCAKCRGWGSAPADRHWLKRCHHR